MRTKIVRGIRYICITCDNNNERDEIVNPFLDMWVFEMKEYFCAFCGAIMKRELLFVDYQEKQKCV